MSIVMRSNQSWFDADQTFRLASEVLSAIDTQFSRELCADIGCGNWLKVANASVKPSDYNDPVLFARDYQASSLVRKAGFLKAPVDKRANARDKFLKAEKKCEETNRRLNGLMDGTQGVGNEVAMAIHTARELIRRILGPVPQIRRPRFGPGATSLVARGITLPQKYSREIHVSPELYPYWRDLCGVNWCKSVQNVTLVASSKVSYVPKTALTDRTICVEPHLNIYAQLAVGEAMRQRFRPWVDLNVGQERNRALAQIAHTADLATVDFASASDTVSRSVVWLLLPEEWCLLMDRVRSHRYSLDGEEYVFEKHSSMGNGYTFELESIIFYAIARAVTCRGNNFFAEVVSSYGDDVILPKFSAPLFIEVCEYLGFEVNRDKSFLSGSFYESCGVDYFNGVNVRPKYWKELNPLFGFKVHNDLLEMSETLQLPQLKDIAVGLRERAPRELRRCLIPSRDSTLLGDCGFVVPFDTAAPSVRRLKNGWCGFITKAMKFQPNYRDYRSSHQALLAALDTGSEQSRAPIRGSGTWRVGSQEVFTDWDALAI